MRSSASFAWLAPVAAALALAPLGLLAPQRALACSQCLCGSPTPPGYLLSGLGPGWSFGLEERYLSKENALAEAPGQESQVEHRLSGLAVWRVAPRLSVQGRLPYGWKTNTAEPTGEAEEITHSHGLGDAELRARADALRFGGGITRRGVLAPVASITAPTGSNDATDDTGARLEAHLQPGAGAWSGSGGLGFDYSFPGGAVSASVIGRWNGTSDHGYHYGNAALYNLGYARTLSPTWEGTLEVNGRSAERDRTEDGDFDPNSGGSITYVAPGLRWLGAGRVALDLLVQIPLVQSLYGDQTEHTTARLGFSWTAR